MHIFILNIYINFYVGFIEKNNDRKRYTVYAYMAMYDKFFE